MACVSGCPAGNISSIPGVAFSVACLVAGKLIAVETPLSAAGIIGSVRVGSQRLVPEVCLKL